MTKQSGAPKGNKNALKHGAPTGNKNALKHGIYSKFITLADDKSLKSMSDTNPKDELSLARVRLSIVLGRQSQVDDHKEFLAYDFAAHYWLDTIVNIKLKSKELEQTSTTVWSTFIDAIRAANDKQVVK
jgi:hypothetical protein